MDALSTLYGWLTGAWTNQNSFGKALLGCALLLAMACVCGIPMLLLFMTQ